MIQRFISLRCGPHWRTDDVRDAVEYIARQASILKSLISREKTLGMTSKQRRPRQAQAVMKSPGTCGHIIMNAFICFTQNRKTPDHLHCQS